MKADAEAIQIDRSRLRAVAAFNGKSPHTPREQPVECAGIAYLADRDQGRVRLIPANVESGGDATLVGGRRSSIALEVPLDDVDVERRTLPANHRLDFRIVKFTNHDDLLQRVGCVNNIWLKASQCLTARVDA